MNNKVNIKNEEIIRDGRGTLVLILINLIVFIGLNIFPDFANTLLLNQEISLILEKPWTLITVFFSHEVLIHIILNMGILVFFGIRLEKITDAKIVIMIYFIAGLMGSLAFPITGLIINRPGLAAGASAAVMGVAAAFSVMRPGTMILKSKAKWWIGALIIFSIIQSIVIPESIDSGVAHLTGIAVGLIFGFWIKSKKR